MLLSGRISRTVPFAALLVLSGCIAADVDEPWARVDDTSHEALREGALRAAEIGLSCVATTRSGPEGVSVHIELKSSSRQSLEFMAWGTPWDELANPFVVAGPDGELAYFGVVAHRDLSAEGEFIAIDPGGSVVKEYPLSYRYPPAAAGMYDVSLRESLLKVKVSGEEYWVLMDCGSGTAYLAVDEAMIAASVEALIPADGCSSEQKDLLNQAFPSVWSASYVAQRTVGNNGIYERFFGRYDATHASNIAAQYEAITGPDWDFAFGCGAPFDYCGPNVLALMINWGAWDQVYACDPFFEMTRPNADARSQSRAEIVIHELVHTRTPWRAGDVSDLGQCGGSCYGLGNALSLAHDPTCTGDDVAACKAVQNAENIAFFAMQSYLALVPSML